uniref:Ribosomal protein L22 like 1 n=1 Tax=Rousettus aegyptiacus TaxID=9407 RepID=A0A7J8HUK0_ROUAE|nr:ribosomal protein L22 like 1 [Rousettus aegyptiacus]
MEFLILQISNSFYGRKLKSMEKLEILGMLFTLNVSKIKSQLFLRNSSQKGI